MFGKKKNSINKVVVSSKEELKTAIKRKEPYIEVQGDLAKKMKWMGKLSSVKIAAIIALLTSLAAVPGGGVLTVSALTAGGVVEAAEANVAIYVISILGIATIIGIFRGYNVEVETGKIIQEPEYFRNRCPFCYEKLGMKATWKRKIKKVCYCPNCHKKIDERFLVY